MADPAPSENPSPPADRTASESQAAGDGRPAPAPQGDGGTFVNTKKHVADQQADGAAVERFANTRLNIALINDPKNGPRFTMTKRESGLGDDHGGETAPERPEARRDPAGTKAPAADTAAPAASRAAAPSAAGIDTAVPPVAGSGSSTADAEPPKAAAGPTAASEPGTAASPVDRPAAPPPAAASKESRQSGVPPAAEAPDKVQIDSTKTFIGHNGTYYDESWRWMDWRGTRRSWNWPAALSFGQWFAYRRLYGCAGLHLLWLAGLAAAAVSDVPILALAVLVIVGAGVSGLYGNTLYFFAFRRAVDHVTRTGEGSYQELQGQLAAAGGTSLAALGVMGALTLTTIGAALAVTHHLRGGFSLNVWPF